MQQFMLIATAHFLALLSPGPDFFLLARTSLSAGWRVASGACLGIALATGAFIAAAFTGVSILRAGSLSFIALQWAGGLYLLYVGVMFMRHAGISTVQGAPAASAPPRTCWWQALVMGFLSAILNPKNALFYVSLASMLASAQSSAGWKLFYGLWMFAVVLGWDLLVALAIGNRRILDGFQRALPKLERLSGALLIALALGIFGVQLKVLL